MASEVRRLSEKSRTSAKEISQLSISSVSIAENAGAIFGEIVPNIKKTAELVQEISAACSEQTVVSQANKAVQQLDTVIQQNASASEEIASTSEELSGQAENLLATIGFFNIGEENGNEQRFRRIIFYIFNYDGLVKSHNSRHSGGS